MINLRLKFLFILCVIFYSFFFLDFDINSFQDKKILLGIKNTQAANQGRILVDEANVYKNPDFDSPVLANLKAGSVYEISSKLFGPFFKIRIKPNQYGYISDVDIKSFKKATNAYSNKNKLSDSPLRQTSSTSEDETKNIKKKAFMWTSYKGLQFSMINYVEKTMANRERVSNIPAYGIKLVGPDLLIDGAAITEINLMMANIPSYYEKYTGMGASGWILISDFIFETIWPQGKSALFFIGFGPLFKYSHYETSLIKKYVDLNGNPTPGPEGKTECKRSYSLDDITMGASFSAGFGLKMGFLSLRFEGKYYWEAIPYLGGSASLLFDF